MPAKPSTQHMRLDYLIVGSGLTGSVLARKLADRGEQVLVVDRRPHPAGNLYDYDHPSGIRVHAYGPHYFRTNSAKIWKFVNKFSPFYKFEAILKSYVDGRYENWPVVESYIKRTLGKDWEPGFKGEPSNFEEASLKYMPRPIYEKFVKGYTEKQWGVPAKNLSADLARRFDVRKDDEPRLSRYKYQGIPVYGYTGMILRMLDGIPVILNYDYLEDPKAFVPQKMTLYTGPIDEYFGYQYGKLKYRHQVRRHRYYPRLKFFQPYHQINYPSKKDGKLIRAIEWKRVMPPSSAKKIPRGAVVTREYPEDSRDPNTHEYPFPEKRYRELYLRYKKKADKLSGIMFCGRLGEYKYYDMDQAIENSFSIVNRVL